MQLIKYKLQFCEINYYKYENIRVSMLIYLDVFVHNTTEAILHR